MEFDNYIVYIKVNTDGYITDVHSSAFLNNLDEWIEIDRGNGDKYHHAQGYYFSKSILTQRGACQYKLVDGVPIECSEEEIIEQENVLILSEAILGTELSIYDELELACREGVNSI